MTKTQLFPLMAAMMLLGLNACQNSGQNTANSQSTNTTNTANTAKSSKGICQLVQGDSSKAGRNVVYRCNGQAVLNSSEAQSVLNSSIPVSFGARGSALKSGLVTRQAANRVGHSDEATCERAFINAAKKFQETAAKMGGRYVSNFHSYLNKRTLSGGQYECEVGTFHGRVVIKADVAR